MAETPAWTVDFMREECLAMAEPYDRATEPWAALVRAADALEDAADAVRRHQVRRVVGVPVIGIVEADGTVRLARPVGRLAVAGGAEGG